jgi:hypothetical protein
MNAPAPPCSLCRWRQRFVGSIVVTVLVVACGRAEAPAPAHQAIELAGGVVARVGAAPIASSEVANVMTAQGLRPRDAVEAVVEDTLFAREAQERLPAPVRDQIERSVLARALVESLWQQARAAPPTEEEVRRWTERKWSELDRPAAAQVCHAVAMLPKEASAEQQAQARAVANRIAEAVRGAESCDEFKRLAEGVPRSDVQVRVEDLAPATADGRVVSPQWPPRTYDIDFSRAANALESPGEISPVTKSSFGFHVIYLVQRIPAQRVPYAKRLEAVREDVYRERGEASLKRLLDEQRRATTVRVERSSEELMRRVEVDE